MQPHRRGMQGGEIALTLAVNAKMRPPAGRGKLSRTVTHGAFVELFLTHLTAAGKR